MRSSLTTGPASRNKCFSSLRYSSGMKPRILSRQEPPLFPESWPPEPASVDFRSTTGPSGWVLPEPSMTEAALFCCGQDQRERESRGNVRCLSFRSRTVGTWWGRRQNPGSQSASAVFSGCRYYWVKLMLRSSSRFLLIWMCYDTCSCVLA